MIDQITNRYLASKKKLAELRMHDIRNTILEEELEQLNDHFINMIKEIKEFLNVMETVEKSKGITVDDANNVQSHLRTFEAYIDVIKYIRKLRPL